MLCVPLHTGAKPPLHGQVLEAVRNALNPAFPLLTHTKRKQDRVTGQNNWMHQTLSMSNMRLTSQVQCNHHSQTQEEGTPGAPVSASPAPQNYEHIPDTEPISGYMQRMA